jgi:nucleoid-associated protein YejK
MEIELRRLVIHELVKTAESVDAQLYLSETLVAVEDRSFELVRRLHRTFEGKSDILLGQLSSPEDNLFPAYFENWRQSSGGDEPFLQFSRDTMQTLQLGLQGVVGAKGGYWVYAEYVAEAIPMLGLFLVRDTEGLIFRRLDQRAGFDLEAVTYLDTNRLAMAARIRLDGSLAKGYQAQLIKHNRSQATISEYFLNWIGLDRTESSRELTENFLDVVEHLPLPYDADAGREMDPAQFQKEVVRYALSAPGQSIELDQFEANFYGSDRPAQNYLSEQGLDFQDGFRVDANTLRRHNRIKVYDNGVSLSFNREHLQDGTVRVEAGKIIIDLPELADQIDDQARE